MDRAQILEKLANLEAHIAEGKERIIRLREKISSLEARGAKAEFDKVVLRECEDLLELQLRIQQKLLKQLSASTR
jgi:hypothetical protein